EPPRRPPVLELIITPGGSAATPVTISFRSLVAINDDSHTYGQWTASAPICGRINGVYYVDHSFDTRRPSCHFADVPGGGQFMRLDNFAPLRPGNPQNGTGYVYILFFGYPVAWQYRIVLAAPIPPRATDQV